MIRAGRIAAAAVGLLVGLPLVAIATMVVVANTEPGQHLIERLAPKLTNGRVTLEGLSGRFPDAVRIAHLAIRDERGTWLAIDRARLNWSPLRLLHGEVLIEMLTAAHVAVTRLPEHTSGRPGGPILPMSVAVKNLLIDRLDVAGPTTGAGATLSVKGDFHLASMDSGAFALDVERLDRAGSYKFRGTLAPNRLAARIDLSEPSRGLLSRIADLPDLGPLSLSASLVGPRHAERANLSVSAGRFRAQGQGTIDLGGKVIDIDLTAAAPAMAPRPDLSWQSARLAVHIHGPLTSPHASGHLEIDRLEAGGGAVGRIEAVVAGDSGTVGLTASLAELRLPGAAAGLFAAAPFELQAKATLNTPQRPVTFTLSHPLVNVTGKADTGAAPGATITARLPSLTPYAAMGGIDVEGHAVLTAKLTRRRATTHFGVDGKIAITGGLPAAVKLVGDRATVLLAGSLSGKDVALDDFAIDGRTLRIAAKGEKTGGMVDLGWQARLSNLSVLTASVAGSLSARGRIYGPQHSLAVSAQATGEMATAGLPKEPFAVSILGQGLPSSSLGKIEVQGRLAGAPLHLALAASRQSDGTLDFSLDRLHWKSATGQGKLRLAPGAMVPLGHIHIRLVRLDDFTALTRLTAGGSIDATLDTVEVHGAPQARIEATGQHLALGGGSVDRLTVGARITDLASHPNLAAVVNADGIRRNAFTGNGRLTIDGTLQSLALRLASTFQTPQGQMKLSTVATARLPQRDLQLSLLQVEYRGQTARLLAPSRIGLAEGVSVDSLRIGIDRAVVVLAGRLTPALDLTVSARDISPTLAEPFLPGFEGSGTFALDARLRGTLAAPEGTLRLSGRRLRLASGKFGGLPPADIDATAIIAGNVTRLDARLGAGSSIHVRLAGTVPLQSSAILALRLGGSGDLAVLDPLLTPNGRTARGQVRLELGIGGTIAAPRATGTIRLVRGSLQDFIQGIHITDMSGLVQAEGDTLRIAEFTGHAGGGTLSVAGTIGILRPAVPIALAVSARNARPLASDLLRAAMDADLTLQGQLGGTLRAAGTIHVDRADINLPDSLPQGVAVLNVRRPGAKPVAEPVTRRAITLALTIAAPQQVFVRRHGIDAEMGGTLKIVGNAAAPVISGGFDLVHGTFSLAGQTLTFTSGKVAFGGSGLANKLDPTIDFVAQTTANNLTATLTVTGYADAPKLKLSSSPQLPQDEILGQLLFGRSVKQLSPVQLATIAQALASLGGVAGGDPMAAVRNSLGLDRLSVGEASNGSGATVEAGKYVARGVFVGAQQDTAGGTQAKVQIDLTKHLKVESRLSTGGRPVTGATPENDPGSSIGLTYQFEY